MRSMDMEVAPRKRASEGPEHYDIRRRAFRSAIFTAWWGSVASAALASVAIGLAAVERRGLPGALALALLPWSVWAGIIAVVALVAAGNVGGSGSGRY